MSMVSWFHRFRGVNRVRFHGFIGFVLSVVSWFHWFRGVNGVKVS